MRPLQGAIVGQKTHGAGISRFDVSNFLSFQTQDRGMGSAFIESCFQHLWGWVQEGHKIAIQYTLVAAPVAAVTRRQHALLCIVVLLGDMPWC
jgi:hypothetical protein